MATYKSLTKYPSVATFLGFAFVWPALWFLQQPSVPQESLNLEPELRPEPDFELDLAAGSSPGPSPNFNPEPEPAPVPEISERPLILYAYKESENARRNLIFFLHQGLHGAADWIPALDNVRVVRRPNVCFDLGAFGEVLRDGDLWRRYRRFITLNASIRGPFVPSWSDKCWSDAYLDECVAWPYDLWWDKFYFGTNLHMYETLFVKANRNVDPVLLELMTGFHVSGRNEGRSWDLCK